MQLFYFSNSGTFENVFEPKRSDSFYANSWENQQKSDCMKMQRGGFKISKRKMSTSKYLRPFRNRDSGEFRNNLSTASAALFLLDA